MKEKVTEFLGNLPKTGSEQFNKALELYRKSKNHTASNVRFMNEMGFSPERLEILLYELKKLHNITDLEVAKARRREKVVKLEHKNDSNEVFAKTVMEFEIEKESEELVEELAENIRAFFGVEKEDSGVPSKDLIQNFQEFLKKEKEVNPSEFSQLLVDLKSSIADATQPDDSEEIGAALDAADAELTADINPGAQETSEATNDSKAVTLENTNEVPSPEPLPNSEEDPVEHKMSPEEIDEQAKGAAAEKEKFLKQDLADFDVEAEKYNGIKSFAAVLSDYINEDPKDQKSETLKAFILDAKKKYLES
ncbi:hypothetical protein [Salinimicrobium sp. WS361]|uniref:hypothetical protein n=1 Tax=Salinimicrobium sp. WS361 TaxID=3425123 RepID=UPI003D6F77D8